VEEHRFVPPVTDAPVQQFDDQLLTNTSTNPIVNPSIKPSGARPEA
jgi:hypothetical protein